MKKYKTLLPLAFLLIFSLPYLTQAQNRFDTLRTVKMTATPNLPAQSLNIEWQDDIEDNTYHLFKKQPNDNTWGTALITTENEDVIYEDTDIELGAVYEYRILKETGDSIGYAYLFAGLDYLPPQQRGGLLLLVEADAMNPIIENLTAYTTVLQSEGWVTWVEPILADATVEEVKELILEYYQNVDSLATVLLLGNIPVPHSGNINPDGHTDHKGAWPADVYYGDMDGIWTDETVNNTSSAYPRLHNVPGDGKFDQDFIPGEIELAIGRMDFSELPVFDLEEYELLNRYLEKNIAFRTGAYEVRRQAVFKNVNGWKEGLGQNAIRNFVPLVSNDSIVYENYFDAFNESFLWSYGGSSGSMFNSNGLGSINTYANANFQVVFTAFFGSYFGDYDFENNYLRTILGSGKVLSTAWVGAPNWYFHPMGMGLDLGFCTRLTQNNQDEYYAGFFPQSVTINLLGDPTLKAYPVKPPTDLTVTQQDNHLILNWSPSTDDILGYQVYQRATATDHFEPLNQIPLTTTTLIDSCIAGNTQFQYLVKAVKREITPSGAFINHSSGPITAIFTQPNIVPEADFTLVYEAGIITATNSSNNATQFQWLLPDGTIIETQNLEYPYDSNEEIIITLIASNSCFSDTLEQTLLANKVADFPARPTFHLYPNPTKDFLTLETTTHIDELQLYHLLGKQIMTLSNIDIGNHSINLQDLPTGTYLLKIRIQDQVTPLLIVHYK